VSIDSQDKARFELTLLKLQQGKRYIQEAMLVGNHEQAAAMKKAWEEILDAEMALMKLGGLA
jgi:hypothetical protein